MVQSNVMQGEGQRLWEGSSCRGAVK